MLFVALPFLLALWEYNLINIVKRMSVVKKNAYIGVDLGGYIRWLVTGIYIVCLTMTKPGGKRLKP